MAHRKVSSNAPDRRHESPGHGSEPVSASARSLAAGTPFTQSLNPAHSTLGSTLVALVPIALLLILLPVLRWAAWQAVIIGAVVTLILAITV